jgi:uncharacterized protein (DUF1778 family)
MARYKQSDSGERLTTGLRVQLTPAQRQELEAAASASGARVSDYVREQIFRRGGQAITAAGTRRNPEAKALMSQLHRIGNNLNQLTHHVNATGEFAEERREIAEAITLLKATMSQCHHLMIPRIKVGSGFTGAVRYILGEGRDPFTGDLKKLVPEQETRVDWIGGTGFGFAIETEGRCGPCPPDHGIRRTQPGQPHS